ETGGGGRRRRGTKPRRRRRRFTRGTRARVEERQPGSAEPAGGSRAATSTTDPPGEPTALRGPSGASADGGVDGFGAKARKGHGDRGILSFFRELPVLIVLAFA